MTARPGRLPALGLLLALAACGNRGGPAAGHGPQADDSTAADSVDATDPAVTADDPGEASGRAAAADSARGVVVVVGADPLTAVALRTAAGTLPLRGPVADTLRWLEGVEVRVVGAPRDDGGFEPSAFRVRGVDGLPADDGVLRIDGDHAVLWGRDGERGRWSPVPAALRGLEGRRVWIAGAPGHAPESWGTIGSTP